MGTYGLDGVMLAWKTEKLTTEQAVGQILQLLQDMEKRVATLERGMTSTKTLKGVDPASTRQTIPETPASPDADKNPNTSSTPPASPTTQTIAILKSPKGKTDSD